MRSYQLIGWLLLLSSAWMSLTAQSWKTLIERRDGTFIETSFCDAVRNGLAQILPPDSNEIDYKTRLVLRDTLFVNNNFAIEVRMQNSIANGGITAFDPGIYLDGCGIDAGVSLMGASWAQAFSSVYVGNQGASDRPELVRDFSTWHVVRLDFQNNIMNVLYDNEVLYTTFYRGSLDFIEEITLRFKGAGLVDWVKLYDSANNLIWNEDFIDCNNTTITPDAHQALATYLRISSDMIACPGSSTRIFARNVPSTTYQWSGPNGFSSTLASFLLNNVMPSDTGMYYLIANYKNCTTFRDSVHVSLAPADTLQAQFLGNDTMLCLGDSLTLGRSYPCATYEWQDGSTGATLDVNKAGEYIVKIELNNQVYQDTIVVQYYALPRIKLGRDTTLCVGDTLVLNAFLPSAFKYRWQDSTARADYKVSKAGLYAVTLTDVCNNVIKDSIQIQYYKVLKALDLGKDTTLCPSDSLLLNVQDSAAVSYQWQDGSTQPSLIARTRGTYAVTLTDACGNTTTDSIRVKHFELVQPFNLGKDTTLCAGETVVLQATDRAAVRYRWQNDSSNTFLIVRAPGLYSVTIEDACGNAFSDSVQVQYHKILQSFNLGRDTTLCPGQTLALNVKDSAALRYRWQDGNTAPNYVADSAGIYAVAITDNCNNIITDSIKIQYYEVIQSVDLGHDTTLCPNETLLLQATNRAAKSYRWQNGSTNATFLVQQPGIYTIQVTDNCRNTVSDTLFIPYFDIINKVDLGKDTFLCPGGTLLLNAKDTAAIRYQWQDGSTKSNLEVKSPGNYAVTLEDNCNNILTDSIQVSYYQLIDSVDIGIRDTILCVGNTLVLNATHPAAGSYQWQDGKTSATYTVTQPGIYQVKVNDNCGNSASDEMRIRYNDVPKLNNFDLDTLVCEGEVFRLNAKVSNATIYQWQDGSTDPIYPVTKPGFYQVIVGNDCGGASYSMNVEMQYCGPCRTFVPNAFSPNGDGNNDEFKLASECGFTHYQLLVFNRWGAQVFGTISPQIAWDGKLNGLLLPNGVYVWQLRYKADDGTEKTMSGDVLLMK